MTPAPDLLADAADLIRAVGERSQYARRYRALASTVAEPAFDRALALGAVLRRALRTGGGAFPEVGAAVAELRDLLAGCDTAIAAVRSSAAHAALVRAICEHRFEGVAELASTVFTDVTPYPEATALFWTVPLSGARGASHFLEPEECAARIATLAADGLPAASPPPDLGADDLVPAVVLLAEPDLSESPVALTIDARRLAGVPCRLADTSTVLAYGFRQRVPFRVWGAETSSDDWWSTGRETYPAYLGRLRTSLAAAGLPLAGALGKD